MQGMGWRNVKVVPLSKSDQSIQVWEQIVTADRMIVDRKTFAHVVEFRMEPFSLKLRQKVASMHGPTL